MTMVSFAVEIGRQTNFFFFHFLVCDLPFPGVARKCAQKGPQELRFMKNKLYMPSKPLTVRYIYIFITDIVTEVPSI